MELTVWVDAWQQQCCGEPFTIGSAVSWTVGPPDPEWLATVLGPEVAATVDAAEEHHGEDARPLRGRVTAISAVHCRYAPHPGADPKRLYAVPGTQQLTELYETDGWTPHEGDLSFVGYLVRLSAEGQ